MPFPGLISTTLVSVMIAETGKQDETDLQTEQAFLLTHLSTHRGPQKTHSVTNYELHVGTAIHFYSVDPSARATYGRLNYDQSALTHSRFTTS